ncbi:MAG: 16S rRNA (uracil(1498)-N(3))-methyltransferase [Prevotellaceae bacterium]|jgi:16S rRNA (uracil1498-N3)-methyltransferase|nr:16S rRNA (uracil(1498)-N(3))-methyltransferase [Prevotellaceae bacterium]
MLLFYTPHISGERYVLPEEESRHCIRVLRLSKGDTLHLTDGRGVLYTAQIIDDSVKHCEIKITGKQEHCGARNYYLHLAVAPTKNNDRYEQFLDTATETGIDEITPVICDHSERRTVKTERLEKILVAAMKQSLKTRLPQLNRPTAFADFIRQPFDGGKYIGCCHPDIPRELFWKALPPDNRRVLMLVGPEGDFSAYEMQAALQAGFKAVSFGESRFRVETAAIIACMATYMN